MHLYHSSYIGDHVISERVVLDDRIRKCQKRELVAISIQINIIIIIIIQTNYRDRYNRVRSSKKMRNTVYQTDRPIAKNKY